MQGQPSWQEIFSRNVKTEPEKIYCIAFTPRSGSTWLGHMIAKTKALGLPKEWFNHNAAMYTIRNSGSGSFLEYYEYLKHFHKANGIFGAEVAFQHFDKLIQEGYEYVFDEVDSWIFLRRRDFVAQAVSLYRAVQSGIYHVRGDKSAPEVHLEYDRDKIAKLVFNIMNQEWRFLQYFEKTGITPSMLWYEDLLPMQAEDILSHLAAIIGVDVSDKTEALKSAGETDFQFTSDSNSKEIAERFKQENRELMDFWNEFRGTCPARTFVDKNPAYAKALTLQIKE